MTELGPFYETGARLSGRGGLNAVLRSANLLRRQVLFLLACAYFPALHSLHLCQHHLRTELFIFFSLD